MTGSGYAASGTEKLLERIETMHTGGLFHAASGMGLLRCVLSFRPCYDTQGRFRPL